MASFNIFTKYKSALADSAKAMGHITSGLRNGYSLNDVDITTPDGSIK